MKFSVLKPVALVMLRELMITFALLLGVSFVVFVILYLAPGDPFAELLGGRNLIGEERDAALRALGIPTTWYGQYLSWVVNMLTGDFGTSIRTGRPVAAELVQGGIYTLYLTLGSLVVSLLIAAPIAILGVTRPGSVISGITTTFAYVISALPVFWLGYIAIYAAGKMFGVFPVYTGSVAPGMAWLYFILPILLLGIGNGTISEIVRTLREELSRVMSEEYMRTARAKGASIWRHAFKEGLLLPISAIIASKMPFVISGAIIVEQVFNSPGLGRLAWQSAQDRDFPVIMGVAIIAAVVVRLGSLAHRMVYVAINPRASQE